MTNKEYARLGKVLTLLSAIAKLGDEISPIRQEAREELKKLGMSEEFIHGIMQELLSAYMPTITGANVFTTIIDAVKEANDGND